MCETIMEAVSLTKHFRSADKTWFTAVDGASISLQKGKTLGLLGQSGSGKSTLGQMMVGLLKPDSGELFFHSKLLSYPIRGQARRRIQILFQHPEVSFNPQLTLRQSLVEPFKLMGKPFDDGAILSVIEPFGLHAEHLARYPGELSGGELQRAALARVTVLEPEMIQMCIRDRARTLPLAAARTSCWATMWIPRPLTMRPCRRTRSSAKSPWTR